MSHTYRSPFPVEEKGKLPIYIEGLPWGPKRTSIVIRALRQEEQLDPGLYGVLSSDLERLVEGNSTERSAAAGNYHHLARHYPDSKPRAIKALRRLSHDRERTVSAKAFGGMIRVGIDLKEVISQAVSMSTGREESSVVIPKDGDFFVNSRYLLEYLEGE